MHLNHDRICQDLRNDFIDIWKLVRDRAGKSKNTPENAAWLREMINTSRTMLTQMPPSSLAKTTRRTHEGVQRFPRKTKKQRRADWQQKKITPAQHLPTIDPLEFLLHSDARNKSWPIYLATKGSSIEEFIKSRSDTEQNDIRRNIASATNYWQCKTCFQFVLEKEKQAYIQCALCLELHHESCRDAEMTENDNFWSCGCGIETEFDLDLDEDDLYN